jgi:hypothetical protein
MSANEENIHRPELKEILQMNSRTLAPFGLAIVIVIAVFATALAMGLFAPNRVGAATVTATTIYSVTNTPITPGEVSTYTIVFENKDELTANSGQIWITFDKNISVPATIEKERITLSTSGGKVSNPAFDPEIQTDENGDTVIKITIGDTDPTTTTSAAALTAFDDTSTSNGHTIKFSSLAGIKNSTVPHATAAWAKVSTDNGVATTAATAIPVYRYLLLDDNDDARGKVVTVTGKGWDSGETATVFIDKSGGTLNTFDASDTVIATSDATISGGAFTATFTVDTNFAVGNNSINAVDGTGTSANNTAQGARYVDQRFGLNGKVAISPESASRGGSIKVTLSDFSNGTVTEIQVGGVPADLSGKSGLTIANNSTAVTVSVPATTPLGTQQVTVVSSVEADRTASVSVTGLTMTVSPSTAVANQSVTVSASGFTASGTIANDKLTVGGIIQDTLTNGNAETTVTADNSGNMVLTFKIPNDDTTRTAGDHTIKITDSGNRIGEVTLTVPARSITIDPTESRRGSTVNIDGSGFVASTTVTVTFLSGTTTTTVATATADSSGAFATTFTVPSGAGIPSSNTVTASSSITATAANIDTQKSATATHKVPGASIAIDPTSAASGTNINVTGLDFPGYVSLATLTIGDVSALPTPAPATDVDGKLDLTALVPALATGSHSVTATVGSGTSAVTATTSFTVTAAAAAAPVVVTTATEEVFADVISNDDNLVRVWLFDNATQDWTFYDPRPAFADANTLTNTDSGNIVWVNVTAEQAFQDGTLYAGWNLISLD